MVASFGKIIHVVPEKLVRGSGMVFLNQLCVLALILLSLLTNNRGLSAERVTFIFGGIQRTVELGELVTMTERKELSGFVADLVKLASVKEENLLDLLGSDFEFDFRNLVPLLYTEVGEKILRDLGQFIFPSRSRKSGAVALRSAIVLSCYEDDRLGLLELIENYPTDIGLDLLRMKKFFSEVDGSSFIFLPFKKRLTSP